MQFNDDHATKYLTSVIFSFTSCFVVIYLLLICVSKKHKTSKSQKNGTTNNKVVVDETVVTAEVAIEVESSAPNEFVNPLSEKNHSPTDTSVKDDVRRVQSDSATQTFEQYDPESVRKSLPLDLNFDTPTKGPVVDVQTQLNEGSGNSDSGNSTYAKVKNVPKREECAYSVVDIKDSSEKYDVVNGDLIRKTDASLKVKQDNLETGTLVHTSSAASELYAKVNLNPDVKEEIPQENSGNSGYYASVTEKKVLPELSSQENSGSSGYYESVNTPQRPENIISEDQRKNSHENNKRTGSLKDKKDNDEMDSKGGGGNGRQKKSSKEKHKHEKKKDEKRHSKEEHMKITSENSPRQGSRFSRVNPLKWSKKHRHHNSDVTVDIITTAEPPKSASLPRDTHPSPRSESTSHVGDEDPPPLPSVDKLLHLTEHRRATRTSSVPDFINSEDTTPSSSPRAPKDIELAGEEGSRFTYFKSDVELAVGVNEMQSDERYSRVDMATKKQLLEENIETELENEVSHVKVIAHASITAPGIHVTQPISQAISRDSIDSDHDYADVSWKENGQISIKKVENEETALISQTIDNDADNKMLLVTETNKANSIEDDYATIDVQKKLRERQMKDLYATVDWSKKRTEEDFTTDEESSHSDEILYEGPYRILPEAPKEKTNQVAQNGTGVIQDSQYECINSSPPKEKLNPVGQNGTGVIKDSQYECINSSQCTQPELASNCYTLI